ncbi:hypothetical protein TI04_11540, partial [Achromatium sp. WMS2]
GAILKKIHHPSIISIADCDYADVAQTRPYLVMEYFPGVSLADYLEQHGALSIAQTVILARLLAEALHAAHQQGIWHRDIKPDNILVQIDDSKLQIKIIDFGLAVAGQRVVQTVMSGLVNHSILGTSLGGTFQYSAPEQLGNIKALIGPWSDVYAFGKTLSKALFLVPNPSLRNYRDLGEHVLVDLIGDCIVDNPKERLQNFAPILHQLPAAVESQDSVVDPTVTKLQEELAQARAVSAKHEAEARLLATKIHQQQQEADLARKRQEEQSRNQQAEWQRKLQKAELARERLETESRNQQAELQRKLEEAELARKLPEVEREHQNTHESTSSPVKPKLDKKLLTLVLIIPILVGISALLRNLNPWLFKDGALLRTLTGHASGVESVAFSPEGALLRTLTGHASDVESVAFSPDGASLASASEDESELISQFVQSTTPRVAPNNQPKIPQENTP